MLTVKALHVKHTHPTLHVKHTYPTLHVKHTYPTLNEKHIYLPNWSGAQGGGRAGIVGGRRAMMRSGNFNPACDGREGRKRREEGRGRSMMKPSFILTCDLWSTIACTVPCITPTSVLHPPLYFPTPALQLLCTQDTISPTSTNQ